MVPSYKRLLYVLMENKTDCFENMVSIFGLLLHANCNSKYSRRNCYLGNYLKFSSDMIELGLGIRSGVRANENLQFGLCVSLNQVWTQVSLHFSWYLILFGEDFLQEYVHSLTFVLPYQISFWWSHSWTVWPILENLRWHSLCSHYPAIRLACLLNISSDIEILHHSEWPYPAAMLREIAYFGFVLWFFALLQFLIIVNVNSGFCDFLTTLHWTSCLIYILCQFVVGVNSAYRFVTQTDKCPLLYSQALSRGCCFERMELLVFLSENQATKTVDIIFMREFPATGKHKSFIDRLILNLASTRL